MDKSLIIGAALLLVLSAGCAPKYTQPELGARKSEILTVGKYQFKDLNKNGTLDPYEDWRLPMEERIADLVSQMTLEEKASLMFHPNIAVNESGEVKYDLTPEEKEALRRAEEERYAGPRWSRNMGCFSESAELTADMTAALIEGAQGDHVGPGKILVHLKHWPGSGPHLGGSGRWLVYPGNNQEYHYLPWKKGIEKGALAAMGYYSGTYYDSLNVNYSYHMSTEVLYGELGFKGAICTDWGVVGNGPLKPSLQGKTTTKDNMEMIINAGVDQMGSETQPELVVELVKEGRVSEERIDQAASRILQWHFILGLFENPYVDPAKALATLQSPENEAFGLECQRVSNVLLTNDGTLPAKEGVKIFVEGIDPAVASAYGTLVEKPADADLIIYRTTSSPDRAGGFGPPPAPAPAQQGRNRRQAAPPAPRPDPFAPTEVDIDFPAAKFARLQELVASGKPVVADINPTGSSLVITKELKALPQAMILSFDPTDTAVMDVVFGRHNPKSKLPFEIPSSMDAVRAQKEDVPFDSPDPSFPFGFGLSY